MRKIVECVPNFSEGRRPEVYNAIADAIRNVPGVHVLDVSADYDHNRCVITFVGDPISVEEGAFQAITVAAKHINLDNHEGEHPRIGATDVCPLIPVKGVSTDECVVMSRRLGQRVGDELGIAVYLYGAAANVPERKKLSDIRRGEYEGWKTEVSSKANRKPDYGPAEPRSWGATVIGVRPFLIAYNIYLNSSDVTVANQIARAVRFSSGGLRHVQALGFLVDGQAQVSMNLTDFSKTPLHRVQEMVKREASRYGLMITKAELIGLAPEKALLDSAKWYLQIDDLGEDQVLELRVVAEVEKDDTPQAFIEAVSAASATPGGGSTAALAGAVGAALAHMVAGLTIGRKKYIDVESNMLEVLNRSDGIRRRLTSAIREDSEAFDQLMAVWKDKSLDEETRKVAIEKATIRAGEVPLEVARLSREVADLALIVTGNGNINAVTDAAGAGILARAAVQIAAMNVRINAQGLRDTDLAQQWREEAERLTTEAADLADLITSTATDRGGL